MKFQDYTPFSDYIAESKLDSIRKYAEGKSREQVIAWIVQQGLAKPNQAGTYYNNALKSSGRGASKASTPDSAPAATPKAKTGQTWVQGETGFAHNGWSVTINRRRVGDRMKGTSYEYSWHASKLQKDGDKWRIVDKLQGNGQKGDAISAINKKDSGEASKKDEPKKQDSGPTTKDRDGNTIRVGDVVAFKYDVENYGKITSISPVRGRDYANVTISNPNGFSGEGIEGDTSITMRSDDIVKD